MDALIVAGAAFSLALVMLVVLIVRHRPDGGFWSWMRESFGSFRRPDELADERGEYAQRVDLAADPDLDLHVDDIMAMAEPGPAYHRPIDVRARRQVPSA